MKTRSLAAVAALAAFGCAAVPAHGQDMDGIGWTIASNSHATAPPPLFAPAIPERITTVPEASCGPGDRPEQGLQGEVPWTDPGFVTDGYRCNLELVGKLPGDGANIQFAWYGNCAYMSTLYSERDPEYASRKGTVVIDASDPRRPRETARLQTPAMVSPHESLKVNQRRGLLGADEGAPTPTTVNTNAVYPTSPGPHVDVYDVRSDCRHPKLLSSIALPHGTGHEGDFAPDGRTYYVSTIMNPPDPAIVPIDLDDPTRARPMLEWPTPSPLRTTAGFHGLTVSPDGNTGYFMAQGGPDNGLAIVDLSDLQARRAHPQIRLLSHVSWSDSDISQVGVQARIGGRPYIITSDEMGAAGGIPYSACQAGQPPFGFARVIDVSEITHPRVVSKLPLQVDDPANCAIVLSEHAAATSLTYSSHYCAVDDADDATALACSWIGSGVRVFDIRDPRRPREIAYYNPPPNPAAVRGDAIKSAIVPRLEQDVTTSNIRWKRAQDGIWTLWFQSMQNGFQVIRFTGGAYPLERRKTHA